jgi:hypothetical protein
MSPVENFQALVQEITDFIGAKPLDPALQSALNERFPYQGAVYGRVLDACRAAIQEGWMCQYENAGVRYGRVIKPTPVLNGFSVDVVDMQNNAGAYHSHPNGEINLIMPLEGDALFDGHAGGWMVLGPGTAHSPAVSQGRALLLYLLPDGKIDFTRH